MALTARSERRITGSGSWTRGIEWQMRQLELEGAGELPRRRKAEGVKARAVTRRRMRIPVLAVAGAAVAGLLAVLVLMSCIELTSLSAETVTLKGTLETLKTENAALNAEYERIFDLASVQEAALAAGMSKPSASQISYVDLSEGDSVVVYRQEDTGVVSTVMLSVRRGFQALKDYFD